MSRNRKTEPGGQTGLGAESCVGSERDPSRVGLVWQARVAHPNQYRGLDCKHESVVPVAQLRRVSSRERQDSWSEEFLVVPALNCV